MRTTLHVALILAVGIGLGLAIRTFRGTDRDDRGPSAGEVVYSNDQPLDVDAATNDQPSRPPDDEAWLSRFQLTERSGQTISSEDLKGQPYVVSFFFTTCVASCVSQNQKLKTLQEEFAGQGVRFLAISVDPEHDRPAVLREYAARFGADPNQWLFLTGDLDYIRRVGAEVFRLPVDRHFHTDRFVLVDADGEIEGFYNWPEPRQFQKLKDRISDMLAEPT